MQPGFRRRSFHKRLLPFGECVYVHLPLDGPAQARRDALEARAVDGVMFGYADISDSYLVWMPHLKMVVSGGEAMPKSLVAQWMNSRPDILIFNVYGPTETTVLVTAVLAGARFSQNTVGKPLSGVRAFILDQHMQPVPVGVPGLLFIGGPYVARGYLNQPEKTAAVFVANPFDRGDRLYNTGDLFKWLPDGSLEFLGRRDGQVKLRGFRVELGEIESVVLRWSRLVVQSCAVAVREDVPGQQRLVAYLVCAGAATLGSGEWGELREHIARHVPSYMVPGAFVQLASLPTNSSGKLDRKRLPAPSSDSDVRSARFARDALENIVAGLFEELLRLNRAVSVGAAERDRGACGAADEWCAGPRSVVSWG